MVPMLTCGLVRSNFAFATVVVLLTRHLHRHAVAEPPVDHLAAGISTLPRHSSYPSEFAATHSEIRIESLPAPRLGDSRGPPSTMDTMSGADRTGQGGSCPRGGLQMRAVARVVIWQAGVGAR